MSEQQRVRHPVLWVPSSYFAEGIPFAVATWTVASMFKSLGHSDGEITVATASVGLAWSMKPLWAAFLERYRTKKFFVIAMELFMALLFGGIVAALELPTYFRVVVGILWMLAFSSATQDICVDGVYLTSLDKKGVAAWAGLQGVFWNIGRMFAYGGIGVLADWLMHNGRDAKTAWMLSIGAVAAAMAGIGLYHYFILPTGSAATGAKKVSEEDVPTSWSTRAGVGVGAGVVIGGILAFGALPVHGEWKRFASPLIGLVIGIGVTLSIIVGWREHVPPVRAFFQKKMIWGMLLFVFLYRTGEGFLLQEAPLFMQEMVEKGGLGLTIGQKSWIDATLSTIVSLVAGVLGSAFIAKYGLKRTILVLALFMNVPHLCYIFLSQMASPERHLSLWLIGLLVGVEKFGYSFGFVGNMVYMMQQIAPGKFKMTHYAYATSLMNLVLIPTQAASGALADWMGYKTFFIFVMIASIPSILAAWKAPFPDPPDVDTEPENEAVAGDSGVAVLGIH
jgi:PAT family beta-lactamase induction signal transducer AmpG